ncbi:MAG: hypothetical protein FWG05_00330 [Kiritimatiellaeota bacterium]|nr:hypothetical protein [Kiritimatiellota bacterium]
MKNINRRLFIPSFILSVFTTVSCFSDSNVVQTATTNPVAANPADEARAAVQKTFDALAKGDVKTAYLQLPASYQKDISSVAKAIAGKIDDDIHKSASEMLIAFADFVIAKADEIVREFTCADEPDPGDPTAADLAASAAALKRLVGKLDLKTLQKGDVAAMLGNPEIAEILVLFKNIISELKITGAVLNPNGTVTVSVQHPYLRVQGNELRKVEGAWISDIVANDWKIRIGRTLADIAKFKWDKEEKRDFIYDMKKMTRDFQRGKNSQTPVNTQFEVELAIMFLMGLLHH